MSSKKEFLPAVLLRFFKMICENNRLLFLIQILLTITIGILPILTTYIWQLVLDEVVKPESDILTLCISMVIFGGLMLSSGYFREGADTVFRNAISKNMQKKVHRKASKIPMDDYETPSLNDLINRAGDSFFYGEGTGFVVVFFYTLQILVSIFLSGVLVWSYHPILIAPLCLLLMAQFAEIQLNKKVLDMEVELAPLRRQAEVYKQYLVRYENVKETRILEAHEFFYDKWEKVMKKSAKREENLSLKIMWMRMGIELAERFTTVAAYLLCVYLSVQNKISVAQFGAVVVLLQQFMQSAGELVRRLQDLHSSSIHIQSGMEFFHLPEENRKKSLEIPVNSISLKNVAYRYPEMNYSAVEQINLDLHENEIIAVVGKNGSGKSTLSKLVSGLITPTEGTVLFNGMPAEQIEFPSLYRDTTTVLQDYTRYFMTVRDNIILGNTESIPPDEEILDLLRKMKISFVSDKGDLSLDTVLGIAYGGKELSGGQWQQLAIARGQLKNARVIILDEPTSALDPLKETQLYETFRSMCRGKMGLIITHRLSLCSIADRIVVMEKGRIVEEGTHQQLVEKNQRYAEMYRKQAEMYRENRKTDSMKGI